MADLGELKVKLEKVEGKLDKVETALGAVWKKAPTDDEQQCLLDEGYAPESLSTVEEKKAAVAELKEKEKALRDEKKILLQQQVAAAGTSAAATVLRTPTRVALRNMGLGEVESPNDAVQKLGERVVRLEIDGKATKQKVEALERRNRYTTRDEHDIGAAILLDLEMGELSPFVSEVPAIFVSPAVPSSLLASNPNLPGKAEDKEINWPMFQVLRHVLPQSVVVKLAVNHSKLLDVRGREQREDILLLSAEDEVWPNVVSMVVGKVRLHTNGWKTALGQAQRRAEAILEMQPWREFVIIIIQDLKTAGFLRLDRTFRPQVSRELRECLRCPDAGGSDLAVAGLAFKVLAHLASLPERLGYTPCPCVLEGVDGVPFESAVTICARSRDRAVFLVRQSDGQELVLKALERHADAQQERNTLAALKDVAGAIQLARDEVLNVHVRCGGDGGISPLGRSASWSGVLAGPYALPLSRSAAAGNSATLFAGYARVLADAAARGYCNNDVSPDNLFVHEGRPIVGDWGIATRTDQVIRGFSGKQLFAPQSVILARKDASRYGSLACDLESLFYVAVCVADGDAGWARKLPDVAAMLRERSRCCGVFGKRRGSRFPDGWEWLAVVAEAFGGDELVDEDRLRRAFGVE